MADRENENPPPPPGDTPPPRDTAYRDPRLTPTTTPTSGRSSSSWIGIIVVLIVIGLLAAWWGGAFRGAEESVFETDDGVTTEDQIIEEGPASTGIPEDEPITAPLDGGAETAPTTPAPAEPKEP